MDEFLKYLKFQKRYSQHTIISYQTDITQFEKFCVNKNYVESIDNNSKFIRNWLVELSEKGLSPNSINRKLSSLSSFYKYKIRQGICARNPTESVYKIKREKKLPVFIDKDTISELFSGNYFKQDFIGKRDKLIIELFYLTGMRRAELINLRCQNISTSRKIIKVTGKRNKERIIPITEVLSQNINEYLFLRNNKNISNEYLLVTKEGKQAYDKLIYRIVRKYLYKISLSKKISPHVLRHTFATYMLNNGADINAIKEILGHRSLAATQIYTHNTFEKLTKTYNQAHPRAQK